MSGTCFTIPADHPCLPGHFPGRPVVPAVVMLDAVIAAAGTRYHARVTGLTRCKFLRPLSPAVCCEITFTNEGGEALRFECRGGGAVLARGQLRLEQRTGL